MHGKDERGLEWPKRYKKLLLESALVVGLVCAAALAGGQSKDKADTMALSGAESGEQETTGQEIPAQEIEIQETGTQETEIQETIQETPVLSGKQVQLLQELSQRLEEGDLEGAARILIEKEQQFISLFYTTMEGEDYLCRGGIVSDEIEGTGIVFQKPGTLFYGSFKNGRPEGSLTAMQAIDLGFPRYDYSIGTWKDGYMEGEGMIGYRYYDETEENMQKEVKKEGQFSTDLMDGPVVYTSISQSGEQLVWNIEALSGVTVLSEEWIYNEADAAYQLLTESDKTAAYSLKETEAESIRWLNLIPWAR